LARTPYRMLVLQAVMALMSQLSELGWCWGSLHGAEWVNPLGCGVVQRIN
jgi:hypothetical protein